MKLSEYMPEVPEFAKQMTSLNSQINMLELIDIKWLTANS